MKKVEGKEGLVKDPQTNTVINVNRNDYERYKQNRKRTIELVQRVDKLEKELAELRARVEQIGRTANEAHRSSSNFTLLIQ